MLLIEDSEDDALLIVRELRSGGYEPVSERVDTASGLCAALERAEWDLITCDWVMPQFSALAALQLIREQRCDVPVIIVSGEVGEEVAVSALQAGAHDYVSKHRLTRLVPAMERELRETAERRVRKQTEEAYRTLVEQSLQGFAIVQDARIVFANPALADITGYSVAQLLSLTTDQLLASVHPQDRDGMQQRMLDQLAGAELPPRVEQRVVRPDGTVRWIELLAARIDYLGKPALQVACIDITERTRAEDALRESEERFRTMADSAPVSIWLADLDKRCTYVNRRWLEFTGQRLEEQVGWNWLASIHPDDRQRCVDACTAGFDGRAPFTVEYRLRRVDGEYRWMFDSAAPRFLGDGTFVGYVGSCIDVTERKAGEAALETSERHFRSLIEHGHDLVAILEADGKVRYVSPSHERLLGHLPVTLVGKNAFDFIHPDDLSMAAQRFAAGLQEPSGVRVAEFRFRHADGSWRVLEGIARNCLDDPSVRGVVVNTRDVTDRRRAEDAIRETSARLTLALEQIPVTLWTTDTQLRITSTIGAEVNFGLKPDEIVGRTLQEYFRTTDQTFIAITSHLRALAGESVHYELAWHGRIFDNRLEPLRDRTNAIVGVVGIGEDITDRRRVEVQRRQAQRLEAIGRLAGGVAHEFNNQLTVIKGSLQLLLAQLPEHDARRCDAERIGSSAEKSAQLARQLLTLSRHHPVEARPLNLSALLEEMEPILRLLASEQITLRLHTKTQLPLMHGDRAQIEQVVMNLVTNARDAIVAESRSVPGGTVTLETADVELNDRSRDLFGGRVQPGRYVMLGVSDDGPGMPPEVREHIFEPFFTTKDVGQGTGLGLATVFGVVQQHHGYVSCASEVGGGTAFRIYFPVAQEAGCDGVARVQKSAAIPLHPSAAATILVVDDDPQVRGLLVRCLADAGYQVHSAAGAEEALTLATQLEQRIDLLLTDVAMPGPSGLSLARQLLDRQPGVRVLFMSGYLTDSIDAPDLRNARFLAKPFDLDVLQRSVRELLARRASD